jgi:hypothetical protein
VEVADGVAVEMEMEQLNEDYKHDVNVLREHLAATLRKQQARRCQPDGSLIKATSRTASRAQCQGGRTPQQFAMLLQLLVDVIFRSFSHLKVAPLPSSCYRQPMAGSWIQYRHLGSWYYSGK